MEDKRNPPIVDNAKSFGDLLSAVADAVGLGVWDYIPQTQRVYWSEQAQEVLGIPRSEHWDLSQFLEGVHPVDRQRIIAALAASMDPESRTPLEVECRIVTPDGGTRWVMVKGSVVFDPSKKRAVEMLGIVLDITLQKQVDRRFEAIVTSAHDAVVRTDLHGRILEWNPAATNIYLYSPEEMVGRTIEILVPPDQADALRYVCDRAKKGETVASVRTEGVRKDGERIQVLLTVSPVFDAGGEVAGISKIAKDVTQQLRVEEQLRQAKRMESIGLLAGGIAHDFNNLLTIINGYASRLLTQLPEDDSSRQQILYIEEAGARAQSLTSQLLAFSRQQVLQPRILSLQQVIGELLPLLTRLIREDIEISTDFDPANDRVEMDQNQLEQVVLNLVVNASDAMPHGGRVVIRTGPLVATANRCALQLADGDFVELAITDTGNGISPEVLPKIFDPFFTTKPIGRGTGLGLASVHGIVKQSGGHVIAESEMGIGTTFRVYLPASSRELDEMPEKSEQPIELPAEGCETILVVEDDALLRRYATEVLSDLGYTVLEASNGVEGLEVSKSAKSIDLLITDVVMPAMSGKHLAEILVQTMPNLRVLYISGYTEETIMRDNAFKPGVQYLPKPFTPIQLQRKVQELANTSTPS